jgi:hypothetical protein
VPEFNRNRRNFRPLRGKGTCAGDGPSGAEDSRDLVANQRQVAFAAGEAYVSGTAMEGSI